MTHWVNAHHGYETFLKQNSIRHTRIKPRTPQSNGMVERFNRTLAEEFYQIAMIKRSILLYLSYKMIWSSLSLIIILKERIKGTG